MSEKGRKRKTEIDRELKRGRRVNRQIHSRKIIKKRDEETKKRVGEE